MTSTYKVEHENGTSTIEGVHAFWFPAGHLVFLNEEGNTFAGFAAGTWHSFKKVEVEAEVDEGVDFELSILESFMFLFISCIILVSNSV